MKFKAYYRSIVVEVTAKTKRQAMFFIRRDYGFYPEYLMEITESTNFHKAFARGNELALGVENGRIG